MSQEQVNAAATFPDVLQCVEDWMKGHRLGKENRFAVVTDGRVYCIVVYGWSFARITVKNSCRYSLSWDRRKQT